MLHLTSCTYVLVSSHPSMLLILPHSCRCYFLTLKYLLSQFQMWSEREFTWKMKLLHTTIKSTKACTAFFLSVSPQPHSQPNFSPISIFLTATYPSIVDDLTPPMEHLSPCIYSNSSLGVAFLLEAPHLPGWYWDSL